MYYLTLGKPPPSLPDIFPLVFPSSLPLVFQPYRHQDLWQLMFEPWPKTVISNSWIDTPTSQLKNAPPTPFSPTSSTCTHTDTHTHTPLKLHVFRNMLHVAILAWLQRISAYSSFTCHYSFFLQSALLLKHCPDSGAHMGISRTVIFLKGHRWHYFLSRLCVLFLFLFFCQHLKAPCSCSSARSAAAAF